MQVTTTHLSIVLEIVAFFLVTLDLYGERRLREAAIAITALLKGSRQRAENGINVIFGVGALGFTVLIVIGMFMPEQSSGATSPLVSTIVILGTIGVMGPLTIIALLCIAWAATTLGIVLVSKVQLHGMMLIGGTILFIASKIIIW